MRGCQGNFKGGNDSVFFLKHIKCMHKFSNNLISFNRRIGGTTDNPGVKWNLVFNCPVDPQTSLR